LHFELENLNTLLNGKLIDDEHPTSRRVKKARLSEQLIFFLLGSNSAKDLTPTSRKLHYSSDH